MVKRYVLTGAPGSGKTTVLRALAAQGQAVVDEAATDVNIALLGQGEDKPWTRSDFCDRIVALQRERQTAPAPPGVPVQFFDRSPLCTLALARFLGRPVSAPLAQEVSRVVDERVYETSVFMVRPHGTIEATPVRRISYAEALAFEAVHEAVYREHGYALVEVPAGPISERCELVHSCVRRQLGERSVIG
jgi:predicted ATPase